MLHAIGVTVSFPAINEDESLKVTQLFNPSRDCVTVPGMCVCSKAIQIIPWYLSAHYIAIADKLRAYLKKFKQVNTIW